MRDGEIIIEWGAVLNGRAGSGWLPMVWNNGRPTLGAWHTYGLNRDDADLQSEAMAKEEAERYIGDWEIVLRKRVSDAKEAA
jgi:hypothetical protein